MTGHQASNTTEHSDYADPRGEPSHIHVPRPSRQRQPEPIVWSDAKRQAAFDCLGTPSGTPDR